MATMSYDDRLKLLGLDRFELRRLHADLTTCYKIINNIVAVPFESTPYLPMQLTASLVAIHLNLPYPNPVLKPVHTLFPFVLSLHGTRGDSFLFLHTSIIALQKVHATRSCRYRSKTIYGVGPNIVLVVLIGEFYSIFFAMSFAEHFLCVSCV